MGTELLRMGWSPSHHGPCPGWNLERPGLVRAVHTQWAAAGAQIHRTNTFTLLPNLAFGSGRELDLALQILGRGIELAREAAPAGVVVVALGPVAPNVSPPTYAPPHCLLDILSRADGILLETWSHPHVVDWARWIRPNREIPLIISGCFRPKEPSGPRTHPHTQFPPEALDTDPFPMETLGGASPGDWANWAISAEAEAVGFNCGWDWTPELVESLVDHFGCLWSGLLWCFPGPVQPEGQMNTNHRGRTMMGGCCGVDLVNLEKIKGLHNLECSTKRL